MKTPYTKQLVQEFNGAAMRQMLIDAAIAQYTAFLNRAVQDCAARLGLTLAEVVQHCTRHCGPSWEELYLEGERVLRVSWDMLDDTYSMTRTFHGPAELIPIT